MNQPNWHPLTINAVHAETDNAICASFDVPDHLKEEFSFTQGQYLTLRAKIDGKEVRRAYSICSGVTDEHMRIGIRRVADGQFSNFANDHFKAGLSIDVMPPQGRFFTELNPNNSKNYMCIAAGSGITPILSITKSILAVEPDSTVTLIYGNRRSNSVMFKDNLGFVKNKYMKRFSWINIMDHEDQGSDLLNGIIDNQKGAALHKSKLINILNTDDVFICGPEAMMSEVSRGFRSSGFDDSRIHYELFASSSEDAQQRMQKSQARVAAYGEKKSSKVTIKADDRTINFQLATVGQNILDAGIDNGLDLPFACKAGVCSTCKAKLIKGQVDMDITHGLEAAEIKAGYILCCQAHPVSEEVEIDFDKR